MSSNKIKMYSNLVKCIDYQLDNIFARNFSLNLIKCI